MAVKLSGCEKLMTDPIAQFAHAKYLSLGTFRKNGLSVPTPVWFAQGTKSQLHDTLWRVGMDHPEPSFAALSQEPEQGIVFYIYSASDAGKVKRIRNNPKVRVAPCDIRGNLRGEWVDAHARFCEPEEAEHGQSLLRKKYGWMKRLGDFFSRLAGHRQTLIAVRLD